MSAPVIRGSASLSALSCIPRTSDANAKNEITFVPFAPPGRCYGGEAISSQLAELDGVLGTKLLRRVGRGLEMTDIGRRVLVYGDDIFSLEAELLVDVRDQSARSALPFRIGIADSVPKSLTYRIVEPAMHTAEDLRLFCKEGRLVSLLADLSVHRLDMVIADRAMPTDLKVRAYNHLLGSSDISVFGAEAVVQALKGTFPALVDGAPFLLPGEEVAIRPALERWFEAQRVRPRIMGEFDDSALLKAFGQGGAGLFVAPTAIADYVCRQYGVRVVGRIESVIEQPYAITTERRIQHPAAVAISQVRHNKCLVPSVRALFLMVIMLASGDNGGNRHLRVEVAAGFQEYQQVAPRPLPRVTHDIVSVPGTHVDVAALIA